MLAQFAKPPTTSLVYAYRKMSSSSSKFLRSKALTNILVYRTNVGEKSTNGLDVQARIQNIVRRLYGPNRFTVYLVDKEELRLGSRKASAACLIRVLYENDYHSTYDCNIPTIELKYNELFREELTDRVQDQLVQVIGDHPRKCNDDSLESMNDETIYLIHSQADQINVKSQGNFVIIDWQKQSESMSTFSFDFHSYFNKLNTRTLGRSVAFARVTSSTMTMASTVSSANYGLVCIANYQTGGQGRNNNQWMSPLGCAMFTLNLTIDASSVLANHLSLLQHLASLALVRSIPSTELNVKIKWPNDVLYGGSLSKLAGILTKSSFQAKSIVIQIGMGVNVDNTEPSLCLNDIVHFYNQNHPANPLELITKESLIASILNQFEFLLDLLEREDLDRIKSLYTSHWLHSGQIVDVCESGTSHKVRIDDIDDNGYLVTVDVDNGDHFVLQPDGNRFDMMANLVQIKHKS